MAAHGGAAETTVTRSPDLEAASGRPPGAVSFPLLSATHFFFVLVSGWAIASLPPHTFALSFHRIPAFSQSARVKGCGVVSTAKAGTMIASEAHTIKTAGTLI